MEGRRGELEEDGGKRREASEVEGDYALGIGNAFLPRDGFLWKR
jgi:hypothetical protein